MRPHVLAERAAAAEPLAADVADQLALARVRQLVRHELVLEQEVLAADGAHEAQPRSVAVPPPLVLAQTVGARVLAVALRTLEWGGRDGQRLADVHVDAVAAERVARVEALEGGGRWTVISDQSNSHRE